MKKEIRRFSLHQTAKVFAFVYFILAALIMIPLGIITLFTNEHAGALFMFLAPFFYLVIGYLGWLLMGAVYNLVAKYFGGIEFETVDKE